MNLQGKIQARLPVSTQEAFSCAPLDNIVKIQKKNTLLIYNTNAMIGALRSNEYIMPIFRKEVV